jgi:hypothetical protein
VNSFLDLPYLKIPFGGGGGGGGGGQGCDKMRWRLNGSGSFDVCSYYEAI